MKTTTSLNNKLPQMASIAIAITTNASANIADNTTKHKPTRQTTNNWRAGTRQVKSSIGGQQQQQQQSSINPAKINKKLLASRAKLIIGKLLESHGAELRRTLFSLRQIFQDDPGLAAEFIESDGLECLMKVAVDADQIHQNYILRALGQLIAYPNGMNGLRRHNVTIRWLYALLASQHQLVVKTSIKLLLLFVEHNENNCLHLCRNIKSVDKTKGSILWTNVVELFKNYKLDTQQQHQDVSLLIDTMTLINKCLSGIQDQETFNKYLEPLEELGIGKVLENCSHLDVQLKRQIDIFKNQNTGTQDENDSNSSTNMDNSAESINTTNLSNTDHARRRRLRQTASLDAGDDDDNDGNSKNDDGATGSSRQGPVASVVITTDNDNYESANESNESQPEKRNGTNSSSDADSDNKQTLAPASKERSVNNRNNIFNVRRNHLQQQQRDKSTTTTTATNLARGKQQRASISSCSSSDSYASYGSGYASGSGNSTDHELKQRSLNNACEPNIQIDTNDRQNNARPNNHRQAAPLSARDNADDDDDDQVDGGDDDDGEEDNDVDRGEDDAEEDEDSQLKQHLSELEQLTDELASRNIFGMLSQPSQSTSDKHHHLSSSTTNKLTSGGSSKSNSSLSAGSNNFTSQNLASVDEVALVSANTNATRVQLHKHQSASPVSTPDNESRSTSATPTSAVQPSLTSTMVASTATPVSSYTPNTVYSSRQIESVNSYQNAQIMNKRPNVATNQYTMLPPSKPSKTQQQSNPNSNSVNSTISSSQNTQSASSISSASKSGNSTTASPATSKQEPYYHNLFQWEQLVSKGVTRPLLINDLDFTDLMDEDDCDLLNSGGNTSGNMSRVRTNQVNGDQQLTINISGAQQHIQNSINTMSSGDNECSPKSRTSNAPASAPPPLPPPLISPWFNTIAAGSRPQSQFMSSPSPPFEYGPQQQQSSGEFQREQSPSNSTYSNYSRNSVCVPQTSTPTRDTSAIHNQVQYSTLQPVTSLRSASSMSSLLFGNTGKYANGKRKKTMKLFWKEVREDRSLLSKLTKKRTIWDEIKPVQVDTQKLEYLFESKAKDLLLSKSRLNLDGLNQRKVKITVLDAKRSNAINIGMTKLPPMRTIKSAILKMDSSIMNREGIEKILTTMMPSEEEKSRIIEAQLANPDTPLGTAEQFLLNLASISALEARLKLWAFQLDYAQIEKEVADPLMDLKQAIEEIERSETFRVILGTLLAIGNFLNSTNVKGFQIDYLEKVPEVKDTVHKHSLLHHLCLFIQDKFDPQLTSDLYSEFGAVNRASKVDYTEVAKNLKKMQQDCKASWDYLKIVAKHDGLANLMNTSSSSSTDNNLSSTATTSSSQQPRSSGKLNNLSKLSMITTVMSSDASSSSNGEQQQSASQQQPNGKQLKTKVSDFLTDCAERIMVLMVIHRRVMNRFQKLLVYLGCPSHQIKQTQPQQILKIINEFALEYRTKRERVREMLMKKQQCNHHKHHLTNRWQFRRSRWAGSQQCIDTLEYSHHHQRPCSTTSSCASYAHNSTCTDSMCTLSSLASDSRSHGNHSHHHQQHLNGSGGNRASSPSGFSQISNYSDYLFDQSSCCNSRQQSVTPVPMEKSLNNSSSGIHHQQHLIRRPHSMSISMFDLQNQQNSANINVNSKRTAACGSYGEANGSRGASHDVDNGVDDEDVHQKDEQLRRLLGAGKSLDGACHELYQMSHWSSTMTKVTRHHPPATGSQGFLRKHRAMSIDSQGKNGELDVSEMEAAEQQQRQSSYYNRYLHNGGQCNSLNDEPEQNSDDEILQSLVRTATAKSSHGTHHGSHGSYNRSTVIGSHSVANKGAKSRILSRFSCDRKSCEYQS